MAFMRSVGVRLRLWTDQYRQDGAKAVETNEDIARSGKGARKGLDEMALGFGLVGGAMLAAAATAVFVTAKFDKQMSEVKAVSGATTEEFEQLREAALAAGASTVFSATESAQAIAELAKAGVSTADILAGALNGALALAAAGSLDLATAATIASNAMNTFGLSGADVTHIADVLSAAANKSAVGVEDLGLGLQQVGLVANQVGFGLEETVGLLAAFGDVGLRGSDGATSLKTALLRLAAPLGEAQELMNKYGISLYDANGNMVDAVVIAGQLQAGLGDLSAAERNAALATIFGADAIRAANVMYGLGADGVQEYIDAVNDQGAAARVAAEKLDNLAGDVQLLGSALEGTFIKSGSASTEIMRDLTQGATKLVGAIAGIPGPVLATTTAVVGLTGVVLLGTAGWIKFSGAVGKGTASLVTAGIVAERTAGKIRVATLAAGGLATAFITLATAAVLLDDGVSGFEKSMQELARGPIDELAAKLGAVGETLPDTVTRLDASLATMASSAEGGAQAMALLEDAAARSGVPLDLLLDRLPQFRDAMAATDRQTDELASTQEHLTRAQLAGVSAGEKLISVWNTLHGAAKTADEQMLEAIEAVKAIKDAFEGAEDGLIGNTEAALKNRLAIADAAQQAVEAADAFIENGGSAAEAAAMLEQLEQQAVDAAIAVGADAEAVRKLADEMFRLPPSKTLTIDVKVRRPSNVSVWGQGFTEMRLGGVLAAAAGRVVQPAIVNSPTVLFGERGTGKEAFVPKEGVARDRALSILGEAASWHGAQVVPSGGYMGGTTGSSELSIRVSWAGGGDGRIEQAILDGLRFQTDQFGGGSVQGFVGTQGRR